MVDRSKNNLHTRWSLLLESRGNAICASELLDTRWDENKPYLRASHMQRPTRPMQLSSSPTLPGTQRRTALKLLLEHPAAAWETRSELE